MEATALKTGIRTAWLWWGGDCELCLSNGGLHYKKPETLPPLHPNCDCVVGEVAHSGDGTSERLEGLLSRGRRLVREMKLLNGDRNLTERERELLALHRRNLDDILRETVESGRIEQYCLNWIEWGLEDAELKSSRIKYRLSLAAAEVATGEPLDPFRYSDRALDKADEMNSRLEAASREFGAHLRAVKAAFADEYGRRWLKDDFQDIVPGWFKKKYRWKIHGHDLIWDVNDFGLSNIDFDTAARLVKKYHIDLPASMSLEEYLCTDEGCARFTAAAIREARDELKSYIDALPPVQRAIMGNLNSEEMDALLVTIYKRGIEKERENLDKQLINLATKGNRQRYLYIGEGYRAWRLWVIQGD